MSHPINIKFTLSKRKNKKYQVTFDYKGRTYIRHFGDKRYEQYKDRTPNKYFSHLDHGDNRRRMQYFARHGITDNPLTALYWANKFLW